MKDYPDDYASIDVRGKVVLLIRFMGVDTGAHGLVEGFSVGTSVANAIKHGAVGVIIVDRFVGAPGSSLDPRSLLALNAYVAIEELSPPVGVSGVPVIVVDPDAARRLVGPVGPDIDQLIGYDAAQKKWDRSLSRDLGVTARISVPLREDVTSVATTVAEVPGFSADNALSRERGGYRFVLDAGWGRAYIDPTASFRKTPCKRARSSPTSSRSRPAFSSW